MTLSVTPHSLRTTLPDGDTRGFQTIAQHPAIGDWEAAYSNRQAVSDVDQWMRDTAQRAATFKAKFEGRSDLDLRYGTDLRERIDVLHPHVAAAGTVVFIHGGYWKASEKESHWHLAAGLLERGWRVAMVEYPLCPAVTIREIAACIRRAVEFVAREVEGDVLVVSGHSAGGHLATWVTSDLSGLDPSILQRVARVVSLSGLHDLRPLVAAPVLNGVLRLTDAEAAALSPALARPAGSFELCCIAGSAELPEFRRQNVLQANLWSGLGLQTSAVEIAGANHYTLLDGLRRPDSAITNFLLPPG